MTDRLKQLLSQCVCGVYISVNEHRDLYQDVRGFLDQRLVNSVEEEMDVEILEQMIASNTIIHIQFYPYTPIGFYDVWHHSLDDALEVALECVNKEPTND